MGTKITAKSAASTDVVHDDEDAATAALPNGADLRFRETRSTAEMWTRRGADKVSEVANIGPAPKKHGGGRSTDTTET